MARQGALGVEELIRNKVSKIRHWKLTSLGKKRPKWGFEFTVMTYNILSQAAADCHIYLYMKCNPQYLSEEYRISRILPEILKSKSDVVCLQEVEQCLYDQRIKKVFDSNGFESIFKKRTGNKTDGCAILWRRSKFNLLKYHNVEFRAKGCEYLNRDNVGLIAVLKPLHPQANQTQLHVATTHLIFNPRRGDVKLCQLRLLLAELERSAFKSTGESGHSYHPTILCGDFNFEPHSPLYQFMENGRLEVTGLVAGNLSGQHVGKDKGGKLFIDKLSLDAIGIDESGHFMRDLDAHSTSKKALQAGKEKYSEGHYASKEGMQMNDSVGKFPGGSSSAGKESEASNGSQRDSFRFLREMVTHLQPKAGSSVDFRNQKDSQPKIKSQRLSSSSSSSGSDSESDSVIFYHDFNFVPAYKYYHQDKKNYPISSMTGNDANTVDHIFYNVKQRSPTSFVEDRLKLLGIYTLPYRDDLRDIDGLPNAHLGSDHLNLMSKFLISFRH